MPNDPAVSTDLEELAKDHAVFLRRLARALVGEGAEAEDLVQDTWLAAATSKSRLFHSPRAWLARTARNLAAASHRKRARRSEELQIQEPTTGEDAPVIVEAIEAEEALIAALRRLEEPFRTAVYLRFREDLSSEEIAQRVGVSVNTVRSRQRRGIARLRAELEREQGDRHRVRVLLLPLVLHRNPSGVASRPWSSLAWRPALFGLGGVVTVIVTLFLTGLLSRAPVVTEAVEAMVPSSRAVRGVDARSTQ